MKLGVFLVVKDSFMDARGNFEGVSKIAYPIISHELLDIICTEKEATDEQKKEITDIAKDLGKYFYPEILFLLTFNKINNPKIAEKICQEISEHKKSLEKKIGRPILIELAARDYIHFRSQNGSPALVNQEKVLSQIAKQAITDSKTDTFTVEQLQIDVQKEIDRSYRYGLTFSIIMIDLDNFKATNDTYGHQKGDQVLQFFVLLLEENLRKPDSLYRFGGDEFLILLPQTSKKGAGKIAGKLIELLNTSQCEAIDQTISVSMGISSFESYHSNSYKRLIKSADKALYKAKAEGKNHIALWSKGKCEILDHGSNLIPKSPSKQNIKIPCHKIIPGCAVGNIFVYKDILSSRVRQYDIKEEEKKEELDRIKRAINSVAEDLSKMQSNVEEEINDEHGAIFLAHKMILQDSSILNDIENELNDRLLNGEIIVRDIFRKLEKRFLLFEDERQREKAQDIRDIGGRVIRKLQGKDNNLLSSLPENTILVSQRLLPSDTVFIDKKHVKAIITVEGSRGSHSAILARALDIPYVTIGTKIEKLPNHSQAVVDSDDNTIYINPDALINEKYNKLIKEKAQENQTQVVSSRPIEINGRKISILANVSTEDEAKKALTSGAEGVGLFRVETIYMSSQIMPDEEMLLSRFMKILKPLKGKEITIRLLDIGSDKVPSYLDLGNEINPALGLRGIRLLLKHRKLLKTQLSACVRLNREIPVKILLPMVSLPSEILTVRNLIKKMAGGQEIQIGAMIETPAAVFHIDDILKVSDFISIGTNDLFQYTMTADRENKDVAGYFDKGFKVLHRTLEEIFRKSGEASKDCTVCGEIAGDNDYIKSMLKIGLTKFSVLPNLISRVRQEIINYSETKS